MSEVSRRKGLYGFEFLDTDNRRANEGERKTYEIKQLWQRNHEIINLSARGFKNVEIAEILGITPTCVSQTLNSELGERKLSEIRLERDEDAKKTVEKIRVLTSKALQVYHDIFDSDESTMSAKKDVADTVVLELSGLRAPTRVQSVSAQYTLTKEELEDFKRRGAEAAKEAGIVIDIKESEEENDSSIGSTGVHRQESV
jgi:predicted transcriptional regulator